MLIFALTVFCAAVMLFTWLPLGLYQVSVGVGTPSDTHFNVTAWPIQDFWVDELTSCIVGGSKEQLLTLYETKQNPKVVLKT